MKASGRLLWLLLGVGLGGLGVALHVSQPRPVWAANDRSEDYILCTGAVAVRPGVQTDGVWLLDYRAGKLLGTLIDRGLGKIIGWAEVDLVSEFGLPPRQNVHFLMTTGMVTDAQAALYVAEVNSGKFGVYTMGMRPDLQRGVVIKRHDLVYFRQSANN
jgi:hypothetical protein